MPDQLNPSVTDGADESASEARVIELRESAEAVIGRYHLLQKIGEGARAGP